MHCKNMDWLNHSKGHFKGQKGLNWLILEANFLKDYSITLSLFRHELKSVQTLLKITHLASRKSYLVIICPNSYEKLTKSEIKSS